jgi:hypothetical protein
LSCLLMILIHFAGACGDAPFLTFKPSLMTCSLLIFEGGKSLPISAATSMQMKIRSGSCWYRVRWASFSRSASLVTVMSLVCWSDACGTNQLY